MASAVFMIRDGQLPGNKITILERLDLPGGALDGIRKPKKGFVIRGGRELGAALQHWIETAPNDLYSALTYQGGAAWRERLAIREMVGAGEPLNPEVIRAVEKGLGITIRDGFGQTETTLLVGNAPGQPVKAGSMGRPMPGVPVVLVDPVTGERTDEGEICLDLNAEPLNLMTGYLADPQRNAAVMAGGYYHTGDVASHDSDGYITYIGRTDDVFKSSDYKVSPFELESVLIEHPAVVEAAVVPQPDDTRLAVPKAYVCLATGWDADADTA